MDYMGLHPLNDPENPLTDEEKKKYNHKAEEIFAGKNNKKE